jgi:hypothetical protein
MLHYPRVCYDYSPLSLSLSLLSLFHSISTLRIEEEKYSSDDGVLLLPTQQARGTKNELFLVFGERKNGKIQNIINRRAC